MDPARGQVWRNKKSQREATVTSIYKYTGGHSVFFRYRTENPNSKATQMTHMRRNTTSMAFSSFVEKFEFVR